MLLHVIVWFAILIGLIVLEAVTADLITVWFMPGAVICIILAAFEIAVPIQITVFFVISIILLALSRTVFKKHLVRKNQEKTNLDLIIGEIGIVTEDIDNIAAKGCVKVNFRLWTARSVNDGDTIVVGDRVRVVALEGVKLICEKI